MERGETLHRVDVVCPDIRGSLPVLLVFQDQATGAPRRTLPLKLRAASTRINGFALRGDERPIALSADPRVQVTVSMTPRGFAYRSARTIAERLLAKPAPPPPPFDRAALAARLPPPPVLADPPQVSVMIPTRDRADLLRQALETAVFAAAYPRVETIVVDNGSVEADTRALLEALSRDGRIRVIRHDAPFNFAELNNVAASAATGEILVLLNNDVEGVDPHWLTRLVARALAPGVGAVGARLLYPTGAIQHIGMTTDLDGLIQHFGVGEPADAPGPDGRWRIARPVAAVTAACLAVRRATYDAFGGLDPTFAVEFNDVDFCFRLEAAGLRTWIEPDCVLTHHESVTRGKGRPSPAVMADQIAFLTRWGGRLLQQSRLD